MYLLNKEHPFCNFFMIKDVQKKYFALYALSVIGPASLAVLALYLQARWELENILFSSHIKITDSGEIFRNILIKTNFVTFAVIVTLVVLLTLYLLGRLNTHFHRMEERFVAMGQGDFSLPPQALSGFNEISSLIQVSEQMRETYRNHFLELDDLLEKIDNGLASDAPAQDLHILANKLTDTLRKVRLPEISIQYED